MLRLAATLEHEPRVAAVGPKIVDADGRLDFSQRRFPRVRSAFARALFVHHLFPRQSWSDDLVRDSSAYDVAHAAEWVSGACILARRAVIELVGMWDEQFFLYGEDIDLCKRIGDAGFEVRFEPGVQARHVGGASTPRTSLAPLLVESRLRFAHKHEPPWAVGLVRVALALELVLRLLVGRGGGAARLGYLRAIPALFVPLREIRTTSQHEGGDAGTVSGAGAGSS